jgi:cubilin
LRFRSDRSVVNRGFQISYRAVLATTVTIMGINVVANNSIKYINSHSGYPNTNYSNNYEQSTRIIAPIGKQIQISSIDFELEKSVPCAYDYLEFGDFGRFCGSLSFKTITTQSNEITLKFRTDGSNVGRGFQISYRSVLAPNITLIGTDVSAKNSINYINSHPGYPSINYLNSYDQSTTIIAPVGERIQISSIDFNLESCSSCSCDYLQIGNFGLFCGSQNFASIIKQSNEIALRFKTDGSNVGRGFQISYRVYSNSSVLLD